LSRCEGDMAGGRKFVGARKRPNMDEDEDENSIF